LKVPGKAGVPLMVIVLDDHPAVTPAGNPVGAPIPVAPVVVCVTGVIKLLTHVVGDAEATPAVLVVMTDNVAPVELVKHPVVARTTHR
jgi:hypothetical protein